MAINLKSQEIIELLINHGKSNLNWKCLKYDKAQFGSYGKLLKINTRDNVGYSPLELAVQKNDYQAVKALLPHLESEKAAECRSLLDEKNPDYDKWQKRLTPALKTSPHDLINGIASLNVTDQPPSHSTGVVAHPLLLNELAGMTQAAQNPSNR